MSESFATPQTVAHQVLLSMRFSKQEYWMGRVRVESSDKMWSTAEGNGKILQYSCIENPMNSIKRQPSILPQCSVGSEAHQEEKKVKETKE